MEEKSRPIARMWPDHSIAGGTPMDTYIVRIYRRGGKHPSRIAGHVVKVEMQERQDFFDLEMLRNILEPMSQDTRPKGPPPSVRYGNNGRMGMADLIRVITEEEKI
jgi:hypothetical protein